MALVFSTNSVWGFPASPAKTVLKRIVNHGLEGQRKVLSFVPKKAYSLEGEQRFKSLCSQYGLSASTRNRSSAEKDFMVEIMRSLNGYAKMIKRKSGTDKVNLAFARARGLLMLLEFDPDNANLAKNTVGKFDDVLKMGLDNIDAYYYRGIAHLYSGNQNKALDDFMAAINMATPEDEQRALYVYSRFARRVLNEGAVTIDSKYIKRFVEEEFSHYSADKKNTLIAFLGG